MKTSLCAHWSTLELVLATLFCFTYIFLKIKQHRLKLCICRIQCTLPPLLLYIIPLIPSEHKATPVAMHMSAGGGRWAVCKLPAATLKPLDGFLLLGLAGFFPRWGARAHMTSMSCLLHGYSLPSPFPLARTTLVLWACFSSHFSVTSLSHVLSWVHWGDLAWLLININY